jgi:flagellar FliJ protein
MKKSARLSVIAKIAMAKERAEAKKLSECRRVVLERKSKLRELEGFLNEYQARFMTLTGQGAHAERIRASHAFMSHLNNAISQQQKAVMEAERAAEECRERWACAKRRMDILQKAVSNLHLQEQQLEQRREQLIIDELTRHKRQDF